MSDDLTPGLSGQHSTPPTSGREPGLGGIEALSHLLEALAIRDNVSRHNAIQTLIDMGDRAVPALIYTLQHHERVYARAGAVRALASIGNEETLPHVARAAGDERYTVRLEALRGLMTFYQRFPDRQIEILDHLERIARQDADNKYGRRAIRLIRETYDTGAPHLLRLLSDKVRKNYITALMIGRDYNFAPLISAIPTLLEYVANHPDEQVRGSAAKILAHMRTEPRIREALLSAFNNDNYLYVRRWALFGLLRYPMNDEIEAIHHQALNATSVEVRKVALHGQFELAEDDHQSQVIQAALNDPSKKIVMWAVRSLSYTSMPEHYHRLSQLLEDDIYLSDQRAIRRAMLNCRMRS